MAKKTLDPNLAAILDSIRATVGTPAEPAPAEPAAGTADAVAGGMDAPPAAAPPAVDIAPLARMPQQTVEEFLAALIRPQVQAWLDQHLAELVQKITAEEIARILDRG